MKRKHIQRMCQVQILRHKHTGSQTRTQEQIDRKIDTETG